MYSRFATPAMWALVFAIASFSHLSHSQNDLNEQEPSAETSVQEIPIEEIPDFDLLALDDNIKSILDQEVKHIRGRKARFNRLHEILYEPYYYNLRYHAQQTRTAIDTFYAGGGNCVSLSNLFVAAARYVGLRASYQSVRVQRQWHKQDGFFEVPGHMNVVVRLGRERAVVEFNQAFMDQYAGHKMVQKVISDKQAKAEFYNNLGVAALGRKNTAEAIAYFTKGATFHPKSDFIWSNMGVAYRHANMYSKAEESYLKALELNSRNKSTIGNLYVLYREWGDIEKTQLYAARAEKYARRNPYYLAKLAQEHLDNQEYDQASKMLKRAIRIQKIEPDFHHKLAVAYYHLGEDKLSQKELIEAKKLASTLQDKLRYQSKMDSLAAN